MNEPPLSPAFRWGGCNRSEAKSKGLKKQFLINRHAQTSRIFNNSYPE
jgi:hypothetical protein